VHKHSKDSCVNLNKTWVDDPGLAFVGKISLWPLWTFVQVLLYNDIVHVPVNSLVSSFRHERIATVRKIYTMMHMQDLINGFDLIKYKATHENHGCMVDHIYLDNSIFSILF
jgi:hypothetical protein